MQDHTCDEIFLVASLGNGFNSLTLRPTSLGGGGVYYESAVTSAGYSRHGGGTGVPKCFTNYLF